MSSNEWYTKPRYIEAAREVLGEIDLDPASSAVANQIVKAKKYYTQEENGLLQPWYGRVWLNPPYGRTINQKARHQSMIRLFTDKLIKSYEQGYITQAIILATTEVNAKWFYPLWNYTVCIPDHRVHFIVQETLVKYCQMFGTCFVYLGQDDRKFIEVFSRFGRIVKAVNRPKAVPIEHDLWDEVAV